MQPPGRLAIRGQPPLRHQHDPARRRVRLPPPVRTGRLFASRPLFFLISGGVGYGVFYTGICFSARYAPGWVVASAWQITMLATPIVLWAFGHPVTRRGLGYCALERPHRVTCSPPSPGR